MKIHFLFFLAVFSATLSCFAQEHRNLYFCRGMNADGADKLFSNVENWATRSDLNYDGTNSDYYNRLETRAASIPAAADYVYMVNWNAGCYGNRGWEYVNAAMDLGNEERQISIISLSGNNTINTVTGGENAKLTFNKWDFQPFRQSTWITAIAKSSTGVEMKIDANIEFANDYAPRTFNIGNVSDSSLTFISNSNKRRYIKVADTTDKAKNTINFYVSRRNSDGNRGFEGGDIIVYSKITNKWDVTFQSHDYTDYSANEPAQTWAHGNVYLLGDETNEAYFTVFFINLYLGKTGGAQAISGSIFSITRRGMVTLLGNEQIADDVNLAYKTPRYMHTDPVETEPITAGVLNLNGFSERLQIVYLQNDELYNGNNTVLKKLGVRGIVDFGAGGEQYFCFREVKTLSGYENRESMDPNLSCLEFRNYVPNEDHVYSIYRLSSSITVMAGQSIRQLNLLRFKGFGVIGVDYTIEESGPKTVSINGKTVNVYEYTPKEVSQ